MRLEISKLHQRLQTTIIYVTHDQTEAMTPVSYTHLDVYKRQIYGFDGNIYGRQIEVQLYHFARPERKFESLDELKAQMHRDMENSLEYMKKAQHVGLIQEK